jgi:ATP-dependent Lon protease
MSSNILHNIPVVPLRDTVIFPNMVMPLFVGRNKSINAIEHVIENNGKIFLVAQKDDDVNNPSPSDMYKVGVVANILQVLRLPDSTIKVLVESVDRAEYVEIYEEEQMFSADIVLLDAIYNQDSNKIDDLVRAVKDAFIEYSKINNKIGSDFISLIKNMSDPLRLSYLLSANINIKIAKKQELLEILDLSTCLEKILIIIHEQISIIEADKRIRTQVKKQIDQTQKEYYLNEQIKAINKELGHGDDHRSDFKIFEDLIKNTELPKEAKAKAESELKKLKTMSPMSAESAVVRHYLEWLLNVPWNKNGKIKTDLIIAQKILDEDHYGLDKVKDRIIEYLAVFKRTQSLKSPILCLVGPPGVGKTSLAKSIAEATGRKFAKIALGGVRDEAEMRGHRRAYIGSMPGKIIQAMRKVKESNPLILLDEIDKMGHDHRGDPASALLEILDPEQNKIFNDHYLEVDYDLSQVLFITTANSMDMSRPLLDRMEIIRIAGYTEGEKLEIAKMHLINKQFINHGIKDGEINIADDAIIDLIRYYTREAGVRNLDREIAKIIRKALKQIVIGDADSINVNSANLAEYIGVKKYNFGSIENDNLIGITNGLAYTDFGGDLLTIEVVALNGDGKIKATGKLGEVMQESTQAAFSYIKSKASEFGITADMYQKKDIHIHVPEGATPKDGPSAGIAVCTSIISALTNVAVKNTVAMTGEITLRGRVLPIGGLKEKLLAAVRGGIKTVIIPFDNAKDLAEISANIKQELEIIPVKNVDEVLRYALIEPLSPLSEENDKNDKIVDIHAINHHLSIDKAVKH